MTELILGGTPVPELADDATVFEDGPWRLVRTWDHMAYELHRDDYFGDPNEYFIGGWIKRDADNRTWRAVRNYGMHDRCVYDGENLDQAIGALWAAREAS